LGLKKKQREKGGNVNDRCYPRKGLVLYFLWSSRGKKIVGFDSNLVFGIGVMTKKKIKGYSISTIFENSFCSKLGQKKIHPPHIYEC